MNALPKARNALARGDQLGVRLAAQGVALRCPAVLGLLSLPTTVNSARSALAAALDLVVMLTPYIDPGTPTKIDLPRNRAYPLIASLHKRDTMLRSRTVHTIHELATQGKSIHQIARDFGLARNTVRKYLRGKPMAAARPNRPPNLTLSRTRSVAGCKKRSSLQL